MLLESYKNAGLLFSVNFVEESSEKGVFGYRGDLVLIEGEIGDDKGHKKPPVAVMRGAVLLADAKLKMLVGAFDEIAELQILLDKYQGDFAPDMRALIYAVNIEKPVQVEINGINFILIPLIQGVPWNEAMEELAMEKSDFKGQSPADKLLTLCDALKAYKPKYPSVSLGEALASTTAAVRHAWGAV